MCLGSVGDGHGLARQGWARRGLARQDKARFFIFRKGEVVKDEMVKRRVVLEGVTDIMFDRYAGDNNTKLEPWQKLYLNKEENICLPNLNVVSFLSAHNTSSAPKRLMDARKFKSVANACLSFVTITPTSLLFKRNGKPIKFGKLENGVDLQSGVYIHHSVARLDKGIPNPKERPALPLPWSLEFNLSIWPNKEIQEQQIINLFEVGGRAIGLGTFRGVFGKFIVKRWDKA